MKRHLPTLLLVASIAMLVLAAIGMIQDYWNWSEQTKGRKSFGDWLSLNGSVVAYACCTIVSIVAAMILKKSKMRALVMLSSFWLAFWSFFTMLFWALFLFATE